MDKTIEKPAAAPSAVTPVRKPTSQEVKESVEELSLTLGKLTPGMHGIKRDAIDAGEKVARSTQKLSNMTGKLIAAHECGHKIFQLIEQSDAATEEEHTKRLKEVVDMLCRPGHTKPNQLGYVLENYCGLSTADI